MNRIYREHRGLMLFAATRKLGSPEHAEDVAQEAAIRMMRRSAPYESERVLAYSAACDEAYCWQRRESQQCRDAARTEPLDMTNPAHHGAAPSAEREAMARIALEEAGHAAPSIVLALAAGYSYDEISEATGLAVGTLASIASRWRKGNR